METETGKDGGEDDGDEAGLGGLGDVSETNKAKVQGQDLIADKYNNNDEIMEADMVAQLERIEANLSEAARQKVNRAETVFQKQIFSSSEVADISALATKAVQAQFEHLSQPESDVLAVIVISRTTSAIDAESIELQGEVDQISSDRSELSNDIKVIERQIANAGGGTAHSPDTIFDMLGSENGTVTIEGLKSLLDDMKGKLDDLNEMSEMTSLRLQMTMDRRSKFISTLSQMMKKTSTTQDILVQNIK